MSEKISSEIEELSDNALKDISGGVNTDDYLRVISPRDEKVYYYKRIDDVSKPCSNFLVSWVHDYQTGHCMFCCYFIEGGYCKHPSTTIVEDWG